MSRPAIAADILAVSKSALTKLCRRLVVELRDSNTCQRCGCDADGTVQLLTGVFSVSTGKPRRIEWAHVVTRNAPSLIFVPWNSLALCGPRAYLWSCHFWFDTRKDESLEWWREKFPDRALKLDAWRHDRNRKKIDRALEKAWLEAEIRKLSGGG